MYGKFSFQPSYKVHVSFCAHYIQRHKRVAHLTTLESGQTCGWAVAGCAGAGVEARAETAGVETRVETLAELGARGHVGVGGGVSSSLVKYHA